MTPELLDLKLATQAMIKGVGGLEAAADYSRLGKSRLGECQSHNHQDSFAPIDVVATLEPLARERSGWPHVTRALCRRMGGMFVERPDVRATGADLLQLLGKHAQESADVSRAICEAVADGKVEPKEARRVRAEVAQAMELLATIDAELAAIEGEDA